MAGLNVPFTVTARLRSGVSLSHRYGLTLDGLLASQIRHVAKQTQLGPGASGSELDGGLDADVPVDWDLPLAKCTPNAEEPQVWHWMCTAGMPYGPDGLPVLVEEPPDPHRLLTRVDDRRAQQVAIRVPADTGGPRGRYRARTTPVLVIPAMALQWRAVGDPDTTLDLLSGIPALGARRGSGEGAVLEWCVTVEPDADADSYAHTWADGRIGRPIPRGCADRVGAVDWVPGSSGLRPPLFHPSRQMLMAVPRI